MQVLDGDTVRVHYHGTLDSGEVFASSRGGEPFRFDVGADQVISGLDDAVRGLAVGDSVTVRLDPAQAFGERDETLVVEMPAANAPPGLAPGDRLQLSRGAARPEAPAAGAPPGLAPDDRAQIASGAPAVVVAIDDDGVRVDTNHPLAGQTLTFEIKLVAIDGLAPPWPAPA